MGALTIEDPVRFRDSINGEQQHCGLGPLNNGCGGGVHTGCVVRCIPAWVNWSCDATFVHDTPRVASLCAHVSGVGSGFVAALCKSVGRGQKTHNYNAITLTCAGLQR